MLNVFLWSVESHLALIHLADRGGLKYPSTDVIGVFYIQWQILTILEHNYLSIDETFHCWIR